MSRRQNDPEASHPLLYSILLLGLVYALLSVVLKPNVFVFRAKVNGIGGTEWGEGGECGRCCRGVENLERWGAIVKWGSEFLTSNLLRSVPKLVKQCVLGLMGLVCVIVGSIVGIGKLVAPNLVC